MLYSQEDNEWKAQFCYLSLFAILTNYLHAGLDKNCRNWWWSKWLGRSVSSHKQFPWKCTIPIAHAAVIINVNFVKAFASSIEWTDLLLLLCCFDICNVNVRDMLKKIQIWNTLFVQNGRLALSIWGSLSTMTLSNLTFSRMTLSKVSFSDILRNIYRIILTLLETFLILTL